MRLNESSSAGSVLPASPLTSEHCFACGTQHPRGLHLRFTPDGLGKVSSSWNPVCEWEGFDGVIHGGIVSTVLDEAMSKAVAFYVSPAFTCDLRVRFKRHVRPGEQLRVSGWVVDHKKRKISTEATLTDVDGRERAHAWAVFLKAS